MPTISNSAPSIIGYVDPLRGRPGSVLEFKISSLGNRPFTARVERIDCADPNPNGPGLKTAPIDFGLRSACYPGLEQPVHPGSCALATIPAIRTGDAACVELIFQSTLNKPELQTIISLQNLKGDEYDAIAIKNNELVFLESRGASAAMSLNTGLGISQFRWYRLAATFGTHAIDVSLSAIDVTREGPAKQVKCTRSAPSPHLDFDRAVVAARFCGFPEDCFNGRIENPEISRVTGANAAAEVIASWDFAADMAQQVVPSTINPEHAAELINCPTRAVRSSSWCGEHMDWKVAPQEYAAIHFHDDDLSDCKWQTSLRLTIPLDTPSAVYGLVVDNESGTDTIPFFVTPAKNGPHAKIAYLASTLTYLAYANHARNNYAGELQERIREWKAYPNNPDVVRQFGTSTYNNHTDGTGISLSSRLRPILTMRPGYLTFPDKNGSGLRHFAADSHLTDWLRAKDIAFDVITDEDLDDEGLSVLAPYDMLLTGSHPEYHTPRMLSALRDFRLQGGHFLYLGGNGFYWKIARPTHSPHLLEIRRAEGGIRAWASEPGEYYHQLDGGYGGLWRRNGWAPQAIGGVGFTVQGAFEGSYYKRTPESNDPEVSWIFDGVHTGIIGDFGLSGGGAAGFELDQVDAKLGTPEGTTIVAVSENHGPSFMTSPEEILTWTLPAGTKRPHAGVCGHMIYTAPSCDAGGIFAVGSITFLGSLSHNNYDNSVSRILENCIKHFGAK